MKRNTPRPSLVLKKESIRHLSNAELRNAGGGTGFTIASVCGGCRSIMSQASICDGGSGSWG